MNVQIAAVVGVFAAIVAVALVSGRNPLTSDDSPQAGTVNPFAQSAPVDEGARQLLQTAAEIPIPAELQRRCGRRQRDRVEIASKPIGRLPFQGRHKIYDGPALLSYFKPFRSQSNGDFFHDCIYFTISERLFETTGIRGEMHRIPSPLLRTHRIFRCAPEALRRFGVSN